jgi:hypothetical protein
MADDRLVDIQLRADLEMAVCAPSRLSRDEDWSDLYQQAHEDRAYLLSLVGAIKEAFDFVAFQSVHPPTMH